jgi:hypothetical protein
MNKNNFKIIITCISIITINDYITIYISNIYYTRLIIFIIIFLLFDIFRIYQDYLDVSKELSITNSNNNMNKIIVEEIKNCNIIISTIITKLIVIENKLIIIENKLKKSQK